MEKVKLDLKKLRQAAYGYQTAIMEKLDRTQAAVSAKMNGRSKMTLEDLNKVCEVIGRKPSEFIVFEETKKAA